MGLLAGYSSVMVNAKRPDVSGSANAAEAVPARAIDKWITITILAFVLASCTISW